jgi:hypothetical protein
LDRDLFYVDWGDCEIPESGQSGEILTVTTRLTNASEEIWPGDGPTRVNLSYRWLDPAGRPVIPDGRRTPLPGDLRPGARIEVQQMVQAPDEPGNYVLELDLVRERVSWFSRQRRASACQGAVEIAAAPATGYSPEP